MCSLRCTVPGYTSATVYGYSTGSRWCEQARTRDSVSFFEQTRGGGGEGYGFAQGNRYLAQDAVDVRWAGNPTTKA